MCMSKRCHALVPPDHVAVMEVMVVKMAGVMCCWKLKSEADLFAVHTAVELNMVRESYAHINTIILGYYWQRNAFPLLQLLPVSRSFRLSRDSRASSPLPASDPTAGTLDGTAHLCIGTSIALWLSMATYQDA